MTESQKAAEAFALMMIFTENPYLKRMEQDFKARVRQFAAMFDEPDKWGRFPKSDVWSVYYGD